VRSKFLKGLGSQSYGSALRKQLESTGEVAILGAGQLVEEILPWISGVGRTIRVFCRNPEKASLRLAKFPDLEIANFNQISPFLGNAGSRAVVVAAPIPAKALNNLLVLLGNANHLVDFRADSDLDLLSGPESVRRLSDFFRELEASASFQYEQVEKAKAAIRALTKQRDNGVAHRPFGWEDVCA
jgi:glutamyl-tRNA reductase